MRNIFFKKIPDIEINYGKIIGGDRSSFFLTPEGDLYACGLNQEGQLGLGNLSNYCNWTKTPLPSKEVIQILPKLYNTFVLCRDALYACGENKYGQMGLEDTENQTHWVKIGPIDKNVLEVKARLSNTFVRCEDGWYGCGDNSCGQLATGDTKKRLGWLKIQAPSGENILEFITQGNHTFVRCEDAWYACGSNEYGELATVANQSKAPILNWVKIAPPGKTVLKLISAPHKIWVQCEDGWYARGSNRCGELNTGNKEDALDWTKSQITDILELRTSDSGESTYIRRPEGWYSCGFDGLSFEDDYSRPYLNRIFFENKEILEIKSCRGWNTLIRCNDGWYARGDQLKGELGMGANQLIKNWTKMGPTGKKEIFEIFLDDSTFALCEDGWYACGQNNFGQLATGDFKSRHEWIKVPSPIPLCQRSCRL